MREGRIRGVVGLPGAGKSLYLAQTIVDEFDEGYRHLITNCPMNWDELKKACPGLTYTFLTNKEIATFWRRKDDCPRGSIVILDESQLVYDAQEWKKVKDEAPDINDYWSQVRKSGDRVYVASQSYADIVLFIRRRVERLTICRKFLFKTFLRSDWGVSQGEVGERVGWWRLVPWAVVRRFGKLYYTHGNVGVDAMNRPQAEFKEVKSLPWLKAGFWAVAIGMAIGTAWYYWPRKKEVPPPPVVKAPQRVRVAPSASSVYIKGGKYDSDTVGAVVKVEPEKIVILTPAPMPFDPPIVRTEKRDPSREYGVIIAQRQARRAIVAGLTKNDAGTDGGGARPER